MKRLLSFRARAVVLVIVGGLLYLCWRTNTGLGSLLTPAVLIAPLLMAFSQLGQNVVAYVLIEYGVLPPISPGGIIGNLQGHAGTVVHRHLLVTELDSGSRVPNALFLSQTYDYRPKGSQPCPTSSSEASAVPPSSSGSSPLHGTSA